MPETPIDRSRWWIALGLVALAAALRFYRLGDWPFAGDELYTLHQTAGWVDHEAQKKSAHLYPLPPLIPLSFLWHLLSITLFGADEFGSRVVIAIVGTAAVGVAFVGLDALRGRLVALATSLLIATWPEHVFQSQQTRFYTAAFLFSLLCVLASAAVVRERKPQRYFWWSLSAIAAVLSHTILLGLLPLTFAAQWAAARAERRNFSRLSLVAVAVCGTLLAVLYFAHLRPLLAACRTSENIGYDTRHAILAAVNQLGWPVFLLAGCGAVIALYRRSPEDWHWLVIAAGWGAAALLLPSQMSFHPNYLVPLTVGLFVLAGEAVGAVAQASQKNFGRASAGAWIALAGLVSLPSLASHYVDGSRTDLRTAAEHLKQHWLPGDRVTGYSMGSLVYYAETCQPAIPLSRDTTVDELQKLADESGRLWIVLQSHRAGLEPTLQSWLNRHCTLECTVRKRRFDYADNRVDVFLFDRKD